MSRALLIACLLITGALSAQPYGNEWVNYDQQYYRIDVAQDGIYRLDHAALISAGIPIGSIDPELIQLYAREQQQPIYISGASDGSIDTGDYIEFYGKGNDGWLDSSMYALDNHIGNGHYSLINDTIHYFLTWGAEAGSRYEVSAQMDFQNYLAAPYLRYTSRVVFSNEYSFGVLLNAANNDPDYVEGEGWMSNRFGKSSSGAVTSKASLIPAVNAYTGSSPAAVGSSVFASASNSNVGDGVPNHHIRVFRGDNDNILLGDFIFNGYQRERVDFSMPHSQVQDVTRVNHVVIDDLDVATDFFRLAYSELTYSHTPDLADLTGASVIEMSLPPNPTQDAYRLTLEGLNYIDPVVYVSGPQPYRIEGMWEDEILNLIIPNQLSGSSKLYIYDAASVASLDLEPVASDGSFTDYGALSPDSAFIIISHPTLMAALQSYAAYRTNAQQDAVLVDIEELYDQYGGGIFKHGLAIRRFCDAMLDTWPQAPGHLFLVGKSVHLNRQDNTNGVRNDSISYARCLLPSYGSPGSDLLFTSRLGPDGRLTPAIPTGRLSAISPQQVSDYLDKVVFNETRDPAAWMKNVLHFGGGNSGSEQGRFASYLNGYEEIIEDTCFGGYVSTFLKESSLPIVVNLSDSISDIIEDGLSLMTFFGHAGGSQFDQSIDDPVNLEWGAHPFVLVNSCFSGDIHQRTSGSTSEQYVLLADKGAIGFIASIQQGFEGTLNQISTEMYRQMSYKNYGKSMGYMMQQMIDSLSSGPGPLNSNFKAGMLAMLLHGDPAVKLFSSERPDLAVDASSISFSPEEVTLIDDSITVSVVIDNYGKTVNSPFGVTLIRTYPEGSQEVYSQSLDRLYYRDTVSFTIATDFGNAFGVNRFEVEVDLPTNSIAEVDDFFNNRVSRDLIITDGGVFPVVPYEYAIVPDASITLMASTGNPFADEKTYSLQIDTTDSFDSPMLLETTITQSGGVLEWTPSLTAQDSAVYYWRGAELADPGEETFWRESSFQYIPEQVGWGQSHIYQFKRNRLNTMNYDGDARRIDYLTGTKLLSCNVYGGSTVFTGTSEYFIDFQSQDYGACSGTPSFHVAVIDPVSLQPWGTRYNGQNPDNDFGNINDESACRSRVENYFIFRQNSAEQMAGFKNMIENEIPDGHYLVIYTMFDVLNTSLPSTLTDYADIFTALGAPNIASIDTTLAFIYMGVVGDPSTASEIVGTLENGVISLDYEMPVSGNSGQMTSTLVGPALTWSTLTIDADEVNPGDSTYVEIIGVDAQGNEQAIMGASYNVGSGLSLDLEPIIDAAQYPQLYLKAYLRDTLEQTAAQIDHWRILYAPVPEAAIDAQAGTYFYADTLQQGEELLFATTIRNISNLDMDSLLVNYWVETAGNERIDIPFAMRAPLLSGASLYDTIRVATNQLSGNNTLWIEANPRLSASGQYHQPEQYHFNNLGQRGFHVTRDRINPLLDVTFDGTHILDGDLVSAATEILVQLDDENPYLLMDDPADTTFFTLFLTSPSGQRKRLNFNSAEGNERMQFIPASGADNVSKIILQPELPEDGTYRLSVLASDKSGNRSGDIQYRISFDVERASSITEVLNYPNPFSTSTQFVFTLTGSKVPDFMKIQIMTVTGRVVKEIFKEELGDIRIGRNITDYAWDGRDEFGDALGNGVYLYRVIVQDAGQDIESRATAASSFFKRGFGKMYLMR